MNNVATEKAAAAAVQLATDDATQDKASLWTLALGSVGVVYGDIGTSPLYAFREAVVAASRTARVTREIVLGVLSMILWALIVVVTIKYVLLLLRADNNGEGGTLSLTALATRALGRRTTLVFLLGVIGASMFLGDSVITPAISVLSAVEGLKLLSPAFEHYVVPLTIAILFGLFAVQSRGTAKVAAFFGPIMLVWFVAIAVAGLMHISDDPRRFCWRSIRGTASRFVYEHGHIGLVTLGAVFLVVTGGEALYADLGHFGRKPIQTAWLFVVLPALLLNYFGQGALVLAHPAAIANPFYRLVPEYGAAADGGARDRRDGDREPGGDHRRLFAGASGDPAWSAAAARDPAHLRVACRADLHPARHHGAVDRRAAAGRVVQVVECARLGLRHRGRHHHGGRRAAGVHRGLEAVALAAVAGRAGGGAAGRGRRDVPVGQPAQSCSRAPGLRCCSAPRWCC